MQLVFQGNMLIIQILLYAVFLYIQYFVFLYKIMLHYLAILLSQVFFIKSVYYSISDNYGVNADEIWMNRNWYYMTAYGSLCDGEKAIES